MSGLTSLQQMSLKHPNVKQTQGQTKTSLHCVNLPMDRIEYDVTFQIFALQAGVCEHVRVCERT